MSGFTLRLLATGHGEVIEAVQSFVGEDHSGAFGLLAQHERFITVLDFGLARVRMADGRWHYLGIPGGVLYFVDNECRISTRRYLRDDDVGRLAQALSRELLAEEEALSDTHQKLQRLESELLQRLTELERN